MFEDVEALAARLLAAAPVQDDPFRPILDPDGTLLTDLVHNARLKAAVEAREMQLMTALCARAQAWQDRHDQRGETRVGPDDLAAAEIAPALHLAPVTAAIKVDRAERICSRLPGTLRLLATGDLDLGRVLAIDEATRVLSDADAAKVEELVLPKATDQTAGELRAALRKAVISVDPGAAEKRRKQAVKDRSVDRYQDKDGTSVLRAVLSAVDTGEIYDLIDQMARRTKSTDDTRSMDARRADMFVWALLGRDPHLGPEDDDDGPPPPSPVAPPPSDPEQPDDRPSDPDQPITPGPVDPRQSVDPDAPRDLDGVDAPNDLDDPGPAEPTSPEDSPPDPAEAVVNTGWRDRQLGRLDRISELAALALSAMTPRRPRVLPWVAINQATNPDGSVCVVGELQGYGPITAEYAEQLLATGAARAPDQPSGRTPTPAQARTHDPPAWLDREVRARDGTCRFPTCKQPAHRIDLDHTIEFPRGLTLRANLGGLCRRHHRVKGTGCWTVRQYTNGDRDGIYEWTSTITGRTYTTYPRGTTGDWRGTTSHQ